jgi:hypothetical protein
LGSGSGAQESGGGADTLRPSHLLTGSHARWLRRPAKCQRVPDSADGPTCQTATCQRATGHKPEAPAKGGRNRFLRWRFRLVSAARPEFCPVAQSANGPECQSAKVPNRSWHGLAFPCIFSPHPRALTGQSAKVPTGHRPLAPGSAQSCQPVGPDRLTQSPVHRRQRSWHGAFRERIPETLFVRRPRARQHRRQTLGSPSPLLLPSHCLVIHGLCPTARSFAPSRHPG